MKLWFSYGSEHSSNLRMIGTFKSADDAQRVVELLAQLTESASSDQARGIVDHWSRNEEFSEETEQRLRDLKIYSLSPADIADFALVNPSIERKGNILRLRTDESEIGAFVKLMVNNGARVEVFCADEDSEGHEDADKR